MVTKHDVIRLHREHPDWCDMQIANELGRRDAYVRSTAQRNGLKLPSRPPRVSRPRNLKRSNPMEGTMFNVNIHTNLADAFAARQRELEDELGRVNKALAILRPVPAVTYVPPEPGRAPMAPRHKPATMRDWIALLARRPEPITVDDVVAAIEAGGRSVQRRSVAVELSKMKSAGRLRKVPKGYVSLTA